jgi:hypothetical protein
VIGIDIDAALRSRRPVTAISQFCGSCCRRAGLIDTGTPRKTLADEGGAPIPHGDLTTALAKAGRGQVKAEPVSVGQSDEESLSGSRARAVKDLGHCLSLLRAGRGQAGRKGSPNLTRCARA